MSNYEEKERIKFLASIDKMIAEEESFRNLRAERLIEAVTDEKFNRDLIDSFIFSLRDKEMMIRGLQNMRKKYETPIKS